MFSVDTMGHTKECGWCGRRAGGLGWAGQAGWAGLGHGRAGGAGQRGTVGAPRSRSVLAAITMVTFNFLVMLTGTPSCTDVASGLFGKVWEGEGYQEVCGYEDESG